MTKMTAHDGMQRATDLRYTRHALTGKKTLIG